MLSGWITLALGIICHIFRMRGVTDQTIDISLFLNIVDQEGDHGGIYVTPVPPIQNET